MARKDHVLADAARLPSSLRSRSGWCDLFDEQKSPFPHLHQIEPTNHCPYTCLMCPRPVRMTRSLGFMDSGLFYKVMNEVAGYPDDVRLKEIELFHFGESLLHPRIVELVRHTSDLGLKAVLSVNAPHLTPGLSKRLLGADPHKIIVSMDGGDAESYQKIRGKVADFEKALSNIRALVKNRAILGSRTELFVE